MTATSTSTRTGTLARARADFAAALPDHFERLRLGGDGLARLQTERLRALLRHAAEHSRFHRQRLAGVDVGTFGLDDLRSLPPMTKAEMMAAYDDVVTDPRLTLDVVNRHLQGLGEEPALLFDRFVVLSSGGSSGIRGVYACELAGAAQHMAAVLRGGLAGFAAAIGWPPPSPVPMTIVAAPTCVHATRGLSSIFLHQGLADITYAPVTIPFDQVVDIVDRSQPSILVGYPSAIARLADAQAAGRLSITPMAIPVTSEQLTADEEQRITRGLGVAPTNSYGTTEGLMGTAPPGSDVFDFASDLAYVEFVDADDDPVAIGEPAHHVLVTNLFNRTQPLIRYRIDDTMIPAGPDTDHGHQRASLEGRNDEQLDLGGVVVHPHTIRSVLAAHATVADYQVRIGPEAGVEIDLVADDARIDLRAIERAVMRALVTAGAPRTAVTARVVTALPADPRTGKTRRFVTTERVG